MRPTVELPAGEVKVSYAESTDPPDKTSAWSSIAPEGFEVTLAPAHGGEPFSFETRDAQWSVSHRGPVAWRRSDHGRDPRPVLIAESAPPLSADRNEPRASSRSDRLSACGAR